MRRHTSSQAAGEIDSVDLSLRFRDALLRVFAEIAGGQRSTQPLQRFLGWLEADLPGSRATLTIAGETWLAGASGVVLSCDEPRDCALKTSHAEASTRLCPACSRDGRMRLVSRSGGTALLLELASPASQLLAAEAGHAVQALGAAIGLIQQEREEHQEEANTADSGAQVLIRELHDSVAQQLGFMSFLVSRVQQQSRKPEVAEPLIAELRTTMTRLQRDVRQLITGARLTLEGRSWRQALADSVDEFSRRCNVVFELDNRMPDIELAPDVALHALQIVREALSNVVRHAHARHARIEVMDDPADVLCVTVTDDGVGLRPASPDENHYGLEIMRERARAIGARVAIENAQPNGTRVRLLVPKDASRRESLDGSDDVASD
ncbi:sensor histidine kinase [Paraburkholderia lacunae]|uniref:histidine kinase n=1 Tax=Paraburkholderia lacunae TaxID=2211104 RepID=A0A370MXD3_9BURK|nr:ATP-binding protein [Paraburkholderia lacunae]RDJ98005.1 histidine kinase [Paraburkholderia lacunae]